MAGGRTSADWRRDWTRAQATLVGGILLPLVVIVSARLWFFPDASPFTVVLLAPATEESLKLAGAIVSLLALAVAGTRGDAGVLHRRLFLVPLFIGGLYGLFEALALYADESGVTLVVRIWAHAAFVVLGLAAALWFWRIGFHPLPGVCLGLVLAVAAHGLFNALSLATAFVPISYIDQTLYAAALFLVAVVTMERVLRREPSSESARRFLATGMGRDQA